MEEKISIESPSIIPSKEIDLKDFFGDIPNLPGVYKFLDDTYEPIYIGKAKSLKKRVSSYFRESSKSKKIEKLLEQAKYIEFSVTNSELESLLHEQFLIKDKKPKYNVQFKDDKGYPWIKVDSSNKFPSASSYLGKGDEEGRFYGPFPNSYAVRDALKLIQTTFKLRNCSDLYFKNRSRPCLQYDIGRCSAPCTGLISQKEYLNDVEGAQLLLEGKSKELINSFYNTMDKLSSKKDFERAAIYRDRISALREIQRSQSIAGFNNSRDAIYISHSKKNVRIGVTSVNQGWVIGHKNYLLKEGVGEMEILENFIQQHYIGGNNCPDALVINQKIENKRLLEKGLTRTYSKKISIITKLSKKDKGLFEVCKINTEQIYKKDNRNRDQKQKIEAIKEKLQVNKLQIIESYDISHHSGDYAVGVCVVFSEKGKEKKQYRTYNISDQNSGNDIGGMLEMIKRRFSKLTNGQVPDLIIIDGSKPHLNAVKKILDDLGYEDLLVIAISKGVRRKRTFDSIHFQGNTILFEENSIFYNFIQEIRDETHRFAISTQKNKRRKKSLASSLDDLEGVGLGRKKILLRYFGSVEQIKRSSLEDLMKVKGIGKKIAQNIYNQLVINK